MKDSGSRRTFLASATAGIASLASGLGGAFGRSPRASGTARRPLRTHEPSARVTVTYTYDEMARLIAVTEAPSDLRAEVFDDPHA